MSDKNEKNEKADDGLAAKVRKIEASVKAIILALEKQFGIDLNKDGKVGHTRIGFALLVALGFAITAGAATIWNLRDAANTYDVIKVTDTGDLTVAGDVSLADTGSVIKAGSVSGTTLVNIELVPKATATVGINPLRLVRVGDLATGDYFGFTSKSNRTVGFTVNVGRPAASWATNTFDTTGDYAANIIANNAATNDTAYVMKGLYLKAKNVANAVVGTMMGLDIEQQQSGSATLSTILRLRDTGTMSDYKIDMGDSVTSKVADIKMPMGALIKNLDANTLEIVEATTKVSGSITVTNVVMAPYFALMTNGILAAKLQIAPVGGPYSNDLVLIAGTVTNVVVQNIAD